VRLCVCETATRCRRCRICAEPGAVWPPHRATPSGSSSMRSRAAAACPRHGTPGEDRGTRRGSKAPRLPQPHALPSCALLVLAVVAIAGRPELQPAFRHLQTSPRQQTTPPAPPSGPFPRARARWFYDKGGAACPDGGSGVQGTRGAIPGAGHGRHAQDMKDRRFLESLHGHSVQLPLWHSHVGCLRWRGRFETFGAQR